MIQEKKSWVCPARGTGASESGVSALDEKEKLVHDLHVHQIELELQNEELRNAQQKLDITRARYFDLYDLAPVGYCTVSGESLLKETNLTAATLLGFTREEMLALPCSRFICSEDQDVFYLHRKNLFATGEPQSFELRMVKKDGSFLWARLQTTLAREEDGSFVCRVVLIDISVRKRDQEKIANLLAEKELILKETHHRVKNNMIMISCLLQLQANTIGEDGSKTVLMDAAQRVQSMIVLYDHLYQTEEYRELSLKSFLESLVAQIVALFCTAFSVEIKIEIEDFLLEAKKILPLGILLNELITNSLKYAFAGSKSGIITISVAKAGARAILVYSDSGTGLPETVNCDESSGFGMQLVGLLVKQIQGELRIDRSPRTLFTIEFDM